MLTDKFTEKVTIYNDVPADAVNPRTFHRFVINKCLMYEQLSEQNASNTIRKIINTNNVLTKDIEHYKKPRDFALLPADLKQHYFTVQPNDFVVLSEVDDVVENALDFQKLQEKYKNNGFSVTAVSAFLNGKETNHIHIMHG